VLEERFELIVGNAAHQERAGQEDRRERWQWIAELIRCG
jgi:hypothetical protein